MADSSKKPDALSPITVVREAIRAVPAVKYALGIAGIVSAIAIVTGGFRIDLRIAVFGTVIMFVLMTVLVLFARLSTTPHHALGVAVIVLAWFSLLLTMLTATVLFASVFFHWPLDLRRWLLSTPTISDHQNPTPEPQSNAPPVTGPVRPVTGIYVKGLNFEIAFVTQEDSESMLGFVQPGAMVSKVDPGPAQEAGFHALDMVIEINGKKIVTKDDLRHAVREIGNGKVSFTLKNESGMRTVSVYCRNCNSTP
jgi:PDZ domain